MPIPPRRRALLRLGLLASVAFVLGALYRGVLPALVDLVLGGRPSARELFKRLDLTTEQCRATFPGLTKEVEDAVARGPFQLERRPDHATGITQGKIENGKLYVFPMDKHPNEMMRWERDSVLHQMYRALITSPEPLPNTTFSFSILDRPRPDTWSFSRSNQPDSAGNDWVMPHFSFWAWPMRFIGTVDEALGKIDAIERETPWEEKVDKAVWRGTAWFNSIGNTQLRQQLLALSKGKEWADVENLDWVKQGSDASNAIPIEGFCRYRYIIYTEGVSYSGRLPFHQACASIILTPPPTYLMHTTHLMRPLFSHTLPLAPPSSPPSWPSHWPSSYPASEANIVFVAPDWSDLEATLAYLRANPDVARGIAERQRAVVVDGGYASEAAETCYWRALMRGWAEVVRTDGDPAWRVGEVVRWETFSLRGKVEW